jgi:hypothetical protein
MCVWLTALLLSAQPLPPVEQWSAEPVFATGFEQDADTDYDGWPDGWTRQRGRGYPHYVAIGIVDDPVASDSHCLRIDLDGGAAALYSPPIPIDVAYNYVLRGKLKTQRLKHDVAFLTLTFYDAQHQARKSYSSSTFTVAAAWEEVQIGPLTLADSSIRYARIGLHVVPTDRSDLQGAAMFDDISLSQLPRMSMSSTQPQNFFLDPAQVKVTCCVSGIPRPDEPLLLELIDVTGRRVDSATLPADAAATSGAAEADQDRGGFVGSLTWNPRVPGYGFYTVRISWPADGPPALEHTMSLVVLRAVAEQNSSEFGWSLPPGDVALDSQPLLALLSQAHVGWLQCPMPEDPADSEALDRLSALVDQLAAQGLEVVGVFATVPESARQQLGHKGNPSVADMFERAAVWQPLVTPMLSRLAPKIRYWQIGDNAAGESGDTAKLETTVREVRTHLQQAGLAVRLGVAWDWMYELPDSVDPPWDYLVMSEPLPFTGAELERYAAASAAPRAARWLAIQPLPKSTYGAADRARDLVLRMLAAKAQGVPMILLQSPFDDLRGLLNHDGTPSELFLPWRVTAEAIGGAACLGSIQLPGGSRNWVFERDGKMILVLWNETPVNETLYLGDDVRQMTVWGDDSVVPSSQDQGAPVQTVMAGPLPIFLSGLDPAVTRWRLHCAIQPSRLTGAFGGGQVARLHCRNTFAESIHGSVTLHAPEGWETQRLATAFELPREGELKHDLNLQLRAEADSGMQRVRMDFDVTADREYQFSVYQDLQVGAGDAVLQLDCWLDDSDQLIVQQTLINNTNELMNFNCYLYAPGRRRLRHQLLNTGPGRAVHTFALPAGTQLLGQTLWLRAEEIGGTRLLNCRVTVEP